MRMFALLLVVLVAVVNGAAAEVQSSCSGSNARIKPASGAIVVDATGMYSGSYKTLSAGVAKLSTSTTKIQTIFIRPGTYKEQVLISQLSGPLVLQGYTCDATSYSSNQVTITHNKALKDTTSDDLTGTVRFHSSSGVKVYNINFANTAGKIATNGQALAVSITATNHGFYGCQFTGYQDTVLANDGKLLFAKSYISGATDFIFGQRALAWFESCDIYTIGSGYITASGRSSSSVNSWYVFNKAKVSGSSGSGSTYLGRPWKPYARVVFQNSSLGSVVNAAGWSKWDSSTSTASVYFKEYKNSGSGASTSKRASFSGQLSKAIATTDILGSNYKSQWWVDTAYL